MRPLTLIALTLVASCEAPRASEAPPSPEPAVAAVALPDAAPEAPSAAPAVALDPVRRARVEQTLAGNGYVPDAAVLKAFGPGTFEALASIADDEGAPPEVRARALASLSYLDDPRAPAELTRALQAAQSSLLVRTALFGLARVRGNAAVAQIAPFLSDRNPTLRLAAAEALGRIGGAAAQHALQQRRDAETDPAVRDALARALSKSNP
jgi:HEAT repeat protein